MATPCRRVCPQAGNPGTAGQAGRGTPDMHGHFLDAPLRACPAVRTLRTTGQADRLALHPHKV